MLFLYKLAERQLGTTQGSFPTTKKTLPIYEFKIRATILSKQTNFSTRFACRGYPADLPAGVTLPICPQGLPCLAISYIFYGVVNDFLYLAVFFHHFLNLFERVNDC